MARDDQSWLEWRALNVIGHELRTPVTTIRGLAEVLSSTSGEEREELVDAIVRNARRLEGLLDDLLAGAGVRTALPAGDAVDVDVHALIRASWPASEVAPGAPAVARVRRGSLQRVLSAVFENASAYGDHAPFVTVERSDREPPAIRIAVSSPGPVLPEEDVRLAAEPFWRGERAVTTRAGLGLGLAVARTLAEHEGGGLTVEARPGGGLVTVIELPAA